MWETNIMTKKEWVQVDIQLPTELEKLKVRMKNAHAQYLKMLYLIVYKVSKKLKKLLKIYVSEGLAGFHCFIASKSLVIAQQNIYTNIMC